MRKYLSDVLEFTDEKFQNKFSHNFEEFRKYLYRRAVNIKAQIGSYTIWASIAGRILSSQVQYTPEACTRFIGNKSFNYDSRLN